MGLDALLTKLLHQDNFHNFGRDPPQDASHKMWSQLAQELQRRSRLKIGLKKMKKKMQNMVNQHNFHNFSIDPPKNTSWNVKSVGAQTSEEIAFEKWPETNEEKNGKNGWISIISITLVETHPRMPHIKFEANQLVNFRGYSVWTKSLRWLWRRRRQTTEQLVIALSLQIAFSDSAEIIKSTVEGQSKPLKCFYS